LSVAIQLPTLSDNLLSSGETEELIADGAATVSVGLVGPSPVEAADADKDCEI
jgi:hypothetical protein